MSVRSGSAAALYVLGQAAIRKLGELAAALRLPPGEPSTGRPGGSQGGTGGASGGAGCPGARFSWIQGW